MGFSIKKALKALLATFGIQESRRITRVLRTFYAPDGKHRLFIYARENGAFGYQEELYDEKSLEMRWIPAREFQPPDSDTAEAALEAARAAVPWLAGLE
jgi:hypothetical protein